LEEVALHVLHARRLRQLLAQQAREPRILLHRDQAADALGDERRERARARPDLDHDVVLAQVTVLHDALRQVLADQEVLAEALAGRESAYRQCLLESCDRAALGGGALADVAGRAAPRTSVPDHACILESAPACRKRPPPAARAPPMAPGGNRLRGEAKGAIPLGPRSRS